MLTSGLVFRALASLLVGFIAMAMRPPRASPSREIHGASRDHYAPDEALGGGNAERRAHLGRQADWLAGAGDAGVDGVAGDQQLALAVVADRSRRSGRAPDLVPEAGRRGAGAFDRGQDPQLVVVARRPVVLDVRLDDRQEEIVRLLEAAVARAGGAQVLVAGGLEVA